MAMLSRVAENLYWLARYLERAENTARLVNVSVSLVLDLPKHARPCWSSLIAITGNEEIFNRLYDDTTEARVVKFMLADENNPGSILSSIRYARENARTIRDIIPREAWEQINDLYLKAKVQLTNGHTPKTRHSLLKDIVLGVQQIAGIFDGCMSHDAGYLFMQLGCKLERADMVTRILDVRAAGSSQDPDALKPFENILWMSVLRSLSAYQMYRRHKQVAVRREEVLQYLLQDGEFPRAFYAALCRLGDCLRRLPNHQAPLAVVRSLKQIIEQTHPETFEQAEFMQFVDELQIDLGKLNESIGATYFGLA
ncbi:alpha-E domain-containing protein [Methylococcus sp. EFPC2]|uniref:alpha-E domain-containing protein n=1 Tax=Methylococcus sp. EFPC2 TaxID=2812648 RepID=UPI001966DF9A|nr:alpha-E domain-containing protein [Methylococcus sp. EFPC2]QSA96177.1 alpha-E domain-containing protein [Methylococcus sp. EFPC2]